MPPPKTQSRSQSQSRGGTELRQSLGKEDRKRKKDVVDDDAISTVSDSFSTVSINEEHRLQQRSLEQSYESNLWCKKMTLLVLLKLPKRQKMVHQGSSFKRNRMKSHIFYFYIKVTDINEYQKYVLWLMNTINHEDKFVYLTKQKVTLKYIHTNYRGKYKECIGYLYFKLNRSENSKTLVKFSHDTIKRCICYVLINEFPNTVPRQGAGKKKLLNKMELIITGT